MSTWHLSSLVKSPLLNNVEQKFSQSQECPPAMTPTRQEHARAKAARVRRELYLSRATIQDLPAEMLDVILKNLDLDSRRNARLVCKPWKKLVDKRVKFHAVLCADTVKYVVNCTRPLEELTVVNLARRRNVPTPNVQNITFGAGISAFTLGRILRHRPEHLKSLTFDHNSLSDVKFDGKLLLKLSLDTLSELRLIVIPTFIQSFQPTRYNHMHGLDGVLSYLVAPSLKSLKGEFNATGNRQRDGVLDVLTVQMMERLLATFAKFAGAHASSLTEIKLEFMAESVFRDNVKLPDLSNLKLNVLQLKLSPKHFLTLLRFPASAQEIQRLELLRNFVHFPTDGEEFGMIIRLHSSTLQHLKIGLVVFKASWIAQCQNLKTLDLKIQSYHRQISQLNSICIPSLEELKLNYAHTESAGTTNNLQFFFWIREGFPNLKKLELEFKLNFIYSLPISLLLTLPKLESIILVQPHMIFDYFDPEWDFRSLCQRSPEVTLRIQYLGTKRALYDFSIKRERLPFTLATVRF